MEIKAVGNQIQLAKVYETIVLKTTEGNRFVVCMRDDTVEMAVVIPDKTPIWYRADMVNGTID